MTGHGRVCGGDGFGPPSVPRLARGGSRKHGARGCDHPGTARTRGTTVSHDVLVWSFRQRLDRREHPDAHPGHCRRHGSHPGPGRAADHVDGNRRWPRLSARGSCRGLHPQPRTVAPDDVLVGRDRLLHRLSGARVLVARHSARHCGHGRRRLASHRHRGADPEDAGPQGAGARHPCHGRDHRGRSGCPPGGGVSAAVVRLAYGVADLGVARARHGGVVHPHGPTDWPLTRSPFRPEQISGHC